MDTFTFAELSKRPKERVREQFRAYALDADWWEHVYADATTIGALIGIEIGENVSRTRRGQPVSSPSISFSGFRSQDDGCSFAGQLYIHEMQFASAKVAEETGARDEVLNALAMEAVGIYNEMAANWTAYRLHPLVEDEDLCTCDRAIRGDFLIKERPAYGTALDFGYDFSLSLEKRLDAFVASFAAWIYKRLEAEHNYRIADAQIEADIDAADFMFDEDGNKV